MYNLFALRTLIFLNKTKYVSRESPHAINQFYSYFMFDQSINYIVIKLKTLFHSPQTEHCCFILTRDLVSGRDNVVDIGPGSEVRQAGVVFHPGQFNQRYYPQTREHKQIPAQCDIAPQSVTTARVMTLVSFL